MRRAGRKKKPLTIQPIKCVVMLSSDEEHDCIGAVREAGFRLFSVDEKEPKVDLYIPPKRGDL